MLEHDTGTKCAAMVNDTLVSSRAFYMRLIALTPNPCFRKDTGTVKQTHSTSYSEYKNMWTQLTQGFFTWGFRNMHVPHGSGYNYDPRHLCSDFYNII